VVDAGVAAAEALGLSWQKMVSRAYHDSLFMAKASLPGAADEQQASHLTTLRYRRSRRALSLMLKAEPISDAATYIESRLHPVTFLHAAAERQRMQLVCCLSR
jgi:hypothetical protein